MHSRSYEYWNDLKPYFRFTNSEKNSSIELNQMVNKIIDGNTYDNDYYATKTVENNSTWSTKRNEIEKLNTPGDSFINRYRFKKKQFYANRKYESLKQIKLNALDDGYDFVLQSLPVLYPNNISSANVKGPNFEIDENEKPKKSKKQKSKKVATDNGESELLNDKITRMVLDSQIQNQISNNYVSDDYIKGLHKPN